MVYRLKKKEERFGQFIKLPPKIISFKKKKKKAQIQKCWTFSSFITQNSVSKVPTHHIIPHCDSWELQSCRQGIVTLLAGAVSHMSCSSATVRAHTHTLNEPSTHCILLQICTVKLEGWNKMKLVFSPLVTVFHPLTCFIYFVNFLTPADAAKNPVRLDSHVEIPHQYVGVCFSRSTAASGKRNLLRAANRPSLLVVAIIQTEEKLAFQRKQHLWYDFLQLTAFDLKKMAG